MANFDAKNIRNVVILGHQGSGKTSLTEALYYVTGGTNQKGEVEKKNTVSDYLPDEQKRGGSIQTAVIPVVYKDLKVNIIDVPGNDDFIGEAIGATKVVKGAILLIDATVGVQVGTIKHWNFLRKANIPTVVLINKCDKEEAKFDDCLADIRAKLGSNAIPFSYPLGHGAGFDGYVDVVDMVAEKFDGKDEKPADLFEDKKAKAEELHNMILEEVAKTSDELLEKYFGGEEFTQEEIHGALRSAVAKGELVPVVCGSAIKNIAIKSLLTMAKQFLPSPADLGALKGKDDNGNEVSRETKDDAPFSGFVFKTVVDPYSGVINYVKVQGREVLLYVERGEMEKGQLPRGLRRLRQPLRSLRPRGDDPSV